jgi:5-methylcytosine-specific restriction protein A
MPFAAPKPCKVAHCPAVTTDPSGYCEVHRDRAKVWNRSRPTAASRGYNYRWQRVREAYMRKHPLCEKHYAKGVVVPAVMVHHRDGNQRNNDPDNLESLCWVCHGEVTAEQQKAKGEGGIKSLEA